MNISAKGNRVICKELPKQRYMKSGIVLPEAQGAKNKICVIISVGEGMDTLTGSLIAPRFKEGEVIVVNPMDAQRINVKKEDFLVVRCEHILATVTLDEDAE